MGPRQGENHVEEIVFGINVAEIKTVDSWIKHAVLKLHSDTSLLIPSSTTSPPLPQTDFSRLNNKLTIPSYIPHSVS